MFQNPLPPLNLPRTASNTNANMAGINTRDFPQLLKESVLIMRNYFRIGYGRVRKAPGTVNQYSVTTGTDAGDAVTKVIEWFPGYDIFCYGNVLKVRNKVSNTTIAVKDDFASEVTDIVTYGGYAYVADDTTGSKVGYLKAALAYDGQGATNFTANLIVTGTTSDAKAVILSDADSGATGILTLKMLSGSFENNELITDTGTGSATVNGTLSVSWTEIADAPKCKYLAIINNNRLGTGNTNTNISGVHISRADQLSGVPFSATADWAIVAVPDPDSPFKVTFDEAKAVQSFGKIGQQTVVLLDSGKFGFRITQIDVSGTGLVLDTPVDFQNVDFGASGKAVSTSFGIFYVNEAGIFQLISGGQTDQPYSSQDQKISSQLDYDFTRNFTFDEADLIYDDRHSLLLITCKDNSSANNVVLCYKLDKQDKGLNGWSTWDKNARCWLKIDNEIYFGDSTETTVSKLDYDLGDNNDNPMYTEMLFEFKAGALNELIRATKVAIGGLLGAETQIDISFDAYDRSWNLSERISLNGNNDTVYYFSGSGAGASLGALGSGSVGGSAIGGRGLSGTELTPKFGQRKMATTDFLRGRLRLTSFDKYQHELNFLTLFTESRGSARTSNLTS